MKYTEYLVFPVCLTIASLLSLHGCGGGRAVHAPSPSSDASLAAADAYKRGDFKRAFEKFSEALKLDRNSDDREEELLDLINIARTSMELGEYDKAREYLNDAVELARNIKDENRLSEAYSTMAKLDYLSGRVEEAIGDMEKSLQIDEKSGYKSGARLNLRGLIYLAAGKNDKAGEALRSALELNKKSGDELEAANSYRALGELSLANDKLQESLDYLRRAYEIDRASGDSRKIALDLEKIAEADLDRGRSDSAAFLLERAYIVEESAGLKKEALDTLNRLIKAYRDIGNKEKELLYMKKRDALLSGTEDAGGKAR